MLWQWLTVIGLSMTPALVLGQSAAAAAGIGFGLDPRILVPVMAVSGFVEGLLVAWLGGKTASLRIGLLQRFIAWMKKPRAVALAARFGPWGGMLLGTGIVGQEPILIALRWLGVDLRRLVLPTAIANALFAVSYYYVVKLGILSVKSTVDPLRAIWQML
jgi:hypothetical protein